MVMFRKAVSPVVATVLLLVLTIIIGGIVFSVVIPFVNDKLGDSKDCLDTFEGVEFPESRFNCYDSNSSETGFSVKINKEKISKVKVGLINNNGNSDVYDIYNGSTVSNLRVLGANPDDPLTFPSVGGQRTYVTTGVYQKAEISALTASGEVCSVADTIEFEPCNGVSF
ncbi:MAG: archaellin/type IV pilin N-terminal domain-containing protein [Nanoarchaeota archaeon]